MDVYTWYLYVGSWCISYVKSCNHLAVPHAQVWYDICALTSRWHHISLSSFICMYVSSTGAGRHQCYPPSLGFRGWHTYGMMPAGVYVCVVHARRMCMWALCVWCVWLCVPALAPCVSPLVLNRFLNCERKTKHINAYYEWRQCNLVEFRRIHNNLPIQRDHEGTLVLYGSCVYTPYHRCKPFIDWDQHFFGSVLPSSAAGLIHTYTNMHTRDGCEPVLPGQRPSHSCGPPNRPPNYMGDDHKPFDLICTKCQGHNC